MTEQQPEPGTTRIHVSIRQPVRPPGCGAVLLLGLLFLIALSSWKAAVIVALVVLVGVYLGVRRAS
jgi:hypothetical protein